ncbi:MAG: D-galactonate dehydratase family member [Verrucomicrobia subdivision 3 bacterium]|nr:D-galactonate dehydratase family member [Limisphaerales bacterium]
MGKVFTHPHEWRPLIAQRLIGGITQAKKIAALREQFGVRTAWQ